MKFHKGIATVLCITALTAIPVMAATQEEKVMTANITSIESLKEYKDNLSLGEFMICVVKHVNGEQPLLMDTHYAHSYMLKAEEMGLIDINDYPVDSWSKPVDEKTIKNALKSLKELESDVNFEELANNLVELLASKIYVNGNELKLENAKVFSYQNKVMVPLRMVSEKLGFNVTWNQKNRNIELKNNDVTSNIEVGYDHYIIKDNKTGKELVGKSIGVAPMLIDGITYIPAETFNLILSDGAVSNMNGIIDISLPQNM